MANIVHTIKLVADAKKAQADIRLYQDQIVAAAQTVKKYEATLNGDQILKAANNWTAAVAKLGGATKDAASAEQLLAGAAKLSATEKEKVNRIISEAIEKYRLLGKEAPSAMTALAEATKKVEPPTNLLTATFGKMAATLVSGGALAGITRLGREFLQTASRLSDLSAQTGIGTTALQRFEYAGKLVGVSLDTMAMAVGQMQRRLASNEDGAVQALERLGITLADLRGMAPEAQFEAIASQISRIPDPAERTRVAMEIFGRSGAQLLPLLRTDLKAVGDEAERLGAVMGDRVVAAGDKLDDLWTKLMASMKASIFNTIEPTITKWEALTFAIERYSLVVRSAGNVVAVPTGPKLPTQAPLGAVRAEKAASAIEAEIMAGIKADWLEREKKAVAALTDEYRKNLEEAKQQQAAYEKYHTLLRITDEALTKAWRSTWTFRQAQGELHGTLHEGAETWLRQREIVEAVNLPLKETLKTLPGIQIELDKTTPKVQQFTLDLGALSQSLANLAQVTGGAFAGIARNLSTVISAFDAAQKGVAQFSTGLEAFKGGGVKNILSGITGMASGIMGIASAAIAAGKAIFNIFDRDKGRDLVEDFAKGFGGFDALHAELLRIGDEGEQLWIKLTQGVGRNNPEQAARVIQEVEAALARYKDTQQEATVLTEAGAAATIETATQASLALDTLNERIRDNAAAWDAWSDEVMGYIRDVANGVAGIAVPTPPGATPAPAPVIPQAVGGDWWVTRPTLFLAGERGPERATFTPEGRSSSRGRATALPVTINLAGRPLWQGLLDVAQAEGLV